MLKLFAGARSLPVLRRSLALRTPTRALSVEADAGAAPEATKAATEAPKKPAETAPPRAETTWASVVIGEIVRFHPHPAADRLNVCHVDVGNRENLLQIICGAPNVREGVRVPVATIGTKLAIADPDSGDIKLVKIKKSKLRGELSQGMICSEAELGLADHSDGILILDDAAPVGSLVREWSAIAARLETLAEKKKKEVAPTATTDEPADGDYRCHI